MKTNKAKIIITKIIQKKRRKTQQSQQFIKTK